jgi:hypothetical protein
MRESLKSFGARFGNEAWFTAPLFPGHGEISTVGLEVQNNPYLEN